MAPDMAPHKNMIHPLTALPACTLAAAAAASGGYVRAVLLGMFVGQMAGLAHDCTHAPPVGPVRWLVTCLGWGVSHTWFREDHLAHHRLCNAPLEDPHFNYTPLFVQNVLEQTTPNPFMQRAFFPIVVLFGRVNIHIISLVYALRKGLMMEILGILANIVWTTSVLETWSCVLVLHIMVGLVVHVPFLLNHYTHDQYTQEDLRKMGWVERQIRTTINYDASWWYAWILCGLDLHIEHHAYPQTPRHLLHTKTDNVLRECKRLNVPYRSETIWDIARQCFVRMVSIPADVPARSTGTAPCSEGAEFKAATQRS